MVKLTIFLLGSVLACSPLGHSRVNSEIAQTFKGTDGNDILEGSSGKDKLLGGLGDDRLNGFEEDDILSGGCGNDAYIFGRVIGNDQVTDSSSCFLNGKSVLENNNVSFTWWKKTEVDFFIKDNDLIATIDSNNSVTFKNLLVDLFVTEFKFQDGVVRTTKDILAELSGSQTRPEWALQNLVLSVFNSEGTKSSNCIQGFAFAKDKTSFVCRDTFLEPEIEATAFAPGAKRIVLEWESCIKTGRSRCEVWVADSKDVTSGEPFKIDGSVTHDGEEDVHQVRATLVVEGPSGKSLKYNIELVSPQFR